MNRITKHYARLYESANGNQDDERKFWTDVQSDFDKNNVSSRDFSIRGLFETFVRDTNGDPCGREIIEGWNPGGGRGMTHLSEAGMGAVTTAAFTKITGQIVYNEIMAAWNDPELIADQLMNSTTTQFLDGEKIAGISAVGDDAEAVAEAQPYPLTGITQEYIETPRPVKRGHILPLTMETLIADRTGVILDRAQTISNTLRMNKEKRVIDCAIGAVDSWKYNGSAATATYGDAGAAPHIFDNLAASNGLVDYTDIDTALRLFDAMVDPVTGEPVMVSASQILVSSSLLYTARRVVNATEIRQGAISATVPLSISANPLSNPSMGGVTAASPFQILTSPYVALRIAADSQVATTWWIGDFKKAFRYMEVKPMTVDTMPSSSEWEFTHDIVRAWKVSEFGVPAVIEPRYVVKCTA